MPHQVAGDGKKTQEEETDRDPSTPVSQKRRQLWLERVFRGGEYPLVNERSPAPPVEQSMRNEKTPKKTLIQGGKLSYLRVLVLESAFGLDNKRKLRNKKKVVSARKAFRR